MNELPVALALLVCERVETDPQTRRLTFVNRRTRYRSARFPSDPTRWSVFAALTDGFGDIRMGLVIDHLEGETEVLTYWTTLRFPDRLQEVPFLINIRNLVFPAAGTYQFTLYAEDEPLARYPLRVGGPATGG